MNWRSIVYFIAVLLLVGGGALTLYTRDRTSWTLASCAAVIVATVAIWWFLLRPKWELPAPSRALARGCCGGKAARTTPPAPTTVAEAVAAVEACTALKTSKEEELAAKQTALTTATGTYNALFESLRDEDLHEAIELYRRVIYPTLMTRIASAKDALGAYKSKEGLVYRNAEVSGWLVQLVADCLERVEGFYSELPNYLNIWATDKTDSLIGPSTAAIHTDTNYFFIYHHINTTSKQDMVNVFTVLFAELNNRALALQADLKALVADAEVELKDYVEKVLPDALSAADAAITATLAAWEDPDTLANITAAGQSIQDAVTSIQNSMASIAQTRLRLAYA